MGKKLLLIEDDGFMRDMIVMVLASEDYQVCGVSSGAEALDLLQKHHDYEAVISDMYLPDSDGFALYRQINRICPQLRFLILTSETDETMIQQATDLGISYTLKDENFAESILTVLRK